ncbi:LAMI_0F13916g1_1 [Lachancea mirantina]|uniref:chitin synthase n=1 Tax=Lachancea mirantina TaxID=1230905 RepID=A0A1G4K3M2_9SACH|nr:LAMI_0F13916g1_1 [Lachancea mirantina]
MENGYSYSQDANGHRFYTRNVNMNISQEQRDQETQDEYQSRLEREREYNDFVTRYPSYYAHGGGGGNESGYELEHQNLYGPSDQMRQSHQRLPVPAINVYQEPQAIPFTQNAVQPLHSDPNFDPNLDVYQGMEYGQNGSSAQSSIGDQYATDTQPILSTGQEQYAFVGNTNYSQRYFSEDPEDPFGYVDQAGDDYQINTFLNNDGEMYAGAAETPDFGASRDLQDEHSTVSYSNSRDLGEYSYENETNTLANFNDSRLLLDDEQNEDLSEKASKGSAGSRRSFPTRKPTTVRKFRLCEGNFIFDCPISDQLLTQYSTGVDDPTKLSNEFKFMRYQAVTCEPAEFQSGNFTLRQVKYMMPRQTELMIVITMYNEDDVLLGRTLKGVMDNIRHLTKKKSSSTWGPDAWKKVVVCVVSDGRSKIHERSLALMSALGCYQDGFAKDEINGKKVVAHVYEHTSKVNITDVRDGQVELACGENTVPIQLLFCLKEKNQKKINSHRWAFEAFAETLLPRVITLLDAGTMPGKDSIYELWREFKDPQVGGACGEIKTDLGSGFSKLLNPLVASQNFEYKLSNILDKTTESNFGFITVLPGAFSAYRLEAVRGEPLRKYFLGDDLNAKVFISNMYLAEDRILCFEVVTKRDSNWILSYSKSAYGSTDVPEKIPEFILQRRRWMNGAFFAALYSFLHFYKIWTSGHSVGRKFAFNFQFLYLILSTLVSWFSLSSFFLVFRILTMSIAITFYSKQVFRILSVVFLWLYGVSVLITFILSLGNKPKGTSKFYLSTFIFFAVLMIYMIFCAIYMSVYSIKNIVEAGNVTFKGLMLQETFRDLIVSMASTYVLYFLSSVLYLQPMHMLTSFVQYILLSPSYINVLNIYAFCNVHDISWGTKGSSAKPLGKLQSKEDGIVKMEIPVSSREIDANYDKYRQLLANAAQEEESEEMSFEEKKTSYYAMVRSLVIIIWVISNFVIIAVVLETGGIGQYESLDKNSSAAQTNQATVTILSARSTIYFSVILWLVAFMAAFRFIGCSLYLVRRYIAKLRR